MGEFIGGAIIVLGTLATAIAIYSNFKYDDPWESFRGIGDWLADKFGL